MASPAERLPQAPAEAAVFTTRVPLPEVDSSSPMAHKIALIRALFWA
jgi:hypothetical protein